MPPLRTFPSVKPVKTERTHEENQERAYIAASRRSDRSLEARVESARRASEIHKRRTGRSLRVTEQDVINEEMYEEEDDDLPSQYRRLTAHLQTGSTDFNRRLTAYLANHVAMRSALEQAINSSFAEQFPNAPQFAHNNPLAFPSPFPPQPLMQMSPPPLSAASAHPYRQTPYPMPGSAAFRQDSHPRLSTTSTPQDQPKQTFDFPNAPMEHYSLHNRRMSMPTQDHQSSTRPSPMPTPSLRRSESATEDKHDGAVPQTIGSLAQARGLDISPFSTALPTGSQLLLGPALNAGDPFTSALMAGSENFGTTPFDPAFYGSIDKEVNFRPSLEGMNSTLAPSALDADEIALGHKLGRQSPEGDKSNLDSYDFSASGNASIAADLDGGWDAFINDDSWGENAT